MQLAIYLAVVPLALAAPILTPRAGTIIPGQYIVKLRSNASQEDFDRAVGLLNGDPHHVYGFDGFKGFAGKMNDVSVNSVAAMDEVEFIEKDAIVQHTALASEPNAPWGLGRVSHVAKGSTTYLYDDSAGAGTCSYIIDTGIYTAHPEFEGRATWLGNFAGDGIDSDGAGHGTHVAGTVGSASYGVAKKTQLYAVKVLDSSGSGSYSGVIAGIDFAANDQKTRNCTKGAVANMSLGGGKSDVVNAAVADAVAAGLFFAIAAGNSADDAQFYSPASEPTACTVGATDINDAIAYFSNYGAVVDIFAPGVDVLSTWNDGKTNTISGTSMATPHITGLGAYLLSLEGKMTPGALCDRIKALADKAVISGIPTGTVNLLAFNGVSSK